MSTSTASALTPKQKQVFDLIVKGETPAAIAKRLKISNSGVYGHIRNIKAAGVALPEVAEEGTTPPPAPPAPPLDVVPNGVVVEPQEALNQALAAGRERIGEIDGEVTDLNAQIEGLGHEKQQLEARLGQYEAALNALR